MGCFVCVGLVVLLWKLTQTYGICLIRNIIMGIPEIFIGTRFNTFWSIQLFDEEFNYILGIEQI